MDIDDIILEKAKKILNEVPSFENDRQRINLLNSKFRLGHDASKFLIGVLRKEKK